MHFLSGSLLFFQRFLQILDIQLQFLSFLAHFQRLFFLLFDPGFHIMQNFFQFLFACGQPKKLKGILRCLSLCSLITIINWLLFYADCNWMLLCRIDWKWSFSPFSKLIWMHERGVIINFELKIWGTTDMFNFILFTSQKTKFFLGLLKKRDFTERDGIVKRTLCQMLLFSSKNSPNFDFRKLGKKWFLKKLRSKKKK